MKKSSQKIKNIILCCCKIFVELWNFCILAMFFFSSFHMQILVFQKYELKGFWFWLRRKNKNVDQLGAGGGEAASRGSHFENSAEGTCRQWLPGKPFCLCVCLCVYNSPHLLLCRLTAAPWARATKQVRTQPASKKQKA